MTTPTETVAPPGRIHCANTELNTVHVEDVFHLTNGDRYTLMIGAESKAPIIRSGNTGKIWAINWEQLIQMARDAGVDADAGGLCLATNCGVSLKVTDERGTTLHSLDARQDPLAWHDRGDIRSEWDSFIEYQTAERNYVTTTSALLFAEYIVARATSREREACAQIVERNAAACRPHSELHDILSANALAIRERGAA